jgi:hypothetical protein
VAPDVERARVDGKIGISRVAGLVDGAFQHAARQRRIHECRQRRKRGVCGTRREHKMEVRETAAPRRISDRTVHALWRLSPTGRDDLPSQLDDRARTRAIEERDPIDRRVRFRLDAYAHEFAADHAEMRVKRARDDIRIRDAPKPLRWRRESLEIPRG